MLLILVIVSTQEPEAGQEQESGWNRVIQQLMNEVGQEQLDGWNEAIQQLMNKVDQLLILVTIPLIIIDGHQLMTTATHRPAITIIPTLEVINNPILINHSLFATIKNAQTGDRTPDLRVISTTL